ncbi:MAG: CinA family protein [Burkholderiaceae bacterium]
MSNSFDELDAVAAELGALAAEQDMLLTTAESCTGGGIARALTETAGSSNWFDRAFITYSNEAKNQMLNVPEALIATHGAVSEPVALAMARGALANSQARLAVAVTGVAGPGGGSAEKPVGTVWFGWGWRDPNGHTRLVSERVRFDGDRSEVRLRTGLHGLKRLLNTLSENPSEPALALDWRA